MLHSEIDSGISSVVRVKADAHDLVSLVVIAELVQFLYASGLAFALPSE